MIRIFPSTDRRQGQIFLIEPYRNYGSLWSMIWHKPQWFLGNIIDQYPYTIRDYIRETLTEQIQK